MIEDCTAIILAGGDSQRMGRDKANMLLGDQTLLQRVIATMQQIFPHVIVSVRQPRPEINLLQICDEQPDSGPLAGLVASLGHVTTPWAFAVACDMPFVVPSMVEYLASYRSKPPSVPPCQGENQGRRLRLSPDKGVRGLGRLEGVGSQAVVPIVQEHPQPLAAFYASSCLAAMREHLADSGKKSLRAVLEQLQVRYVDDAELLRVDPELRSFFDLDTPQDVALVMNKGLKT